MIATQTQATTVGTTTIKRGDKVHYIYSHTGGYPKLFSVGEVIDTKERIGLLYLLINPDNNTYAAKWCTIHDVLNVIPSMSDDEAYIDFLHCQSVAEPIEIIVSTASNPDYSWHKRTAAAWALEDRITYETDSLTTNQLRSIHATLTAAVSIAMIAELRDLLVSVRNRFGLELVEREVAQVCELCGGDIETGNHGVRVAVDYWTCDRADDDFELEF